MRIYKKFIYGVYYVLATLVNWFGFALKRQGRNTVPKTGAVILIANHQSIMDVTVMITMTQRKVYFMGKKELFDKPLLSWAMHNVDAFPISRGEADISGLRTALKILKEGGVLCIFPEGTRNKREDGEVLLPLQEGVAMLALRGKAQVVPVWIEGKMRPFTRNVAVCQGAMDLSSFESLPRTDTLTLSACTQMMRQALLALHEKALTLL